MGKGGSLAVAALMLFMGGLGAAYGSGHGPHDPECTTVRWQPTQDFQGGTTWCPDAGLPGLGGTVPLPSSSPGEVEPHNITTQECSHSSRIGYVVNHNGNHSFVCISIQYVAPTNVIVPGTGQLTGLGVEACQAPDVGWVFEVSLVWVGACLTYDILTPTQFDNPNPRASADDCRVASGQGADPAVMVFDGGFAFCAMIVFHTVNPDEPERPPPIGYDLEPCSVHGIDPAVTIGDGGVFICVEIKIHW